MHDIHAALARALEAGDPVALGTLIETRGSTPQVTGASALFSPAGLQAGTLGGGLLEADGQERALRALASGESVVFSCDLMADISNAEGAICGGFARILIDVHPELHRAAFRAMAAALERGEAGALLTLVEAAEGEKVQIARHWVCEEELSEEAHARWYFASAAQIARAIADRTPATLREGGTEPVVAGLGQLLFVQPVHPMPRLVITGAGHIGRALAHYGKRLDFEVLVIDDRAELANSGNIPEADAFIVDDVGRAVAGLMLHQDTYIVIVNRGHRGDAEVLRECVASRAAYIGMIGSKRKVAQLREQFIAEGWATAAQFDRVHAPIGIRIDAKTVEEIAVSIAAELVSERRRRLRGEQGP